MDFNSTIDLIIKDLEEAREIIDDLKRYQGVPAIQVELAKSKCKSAAEVIALLKTISYGQPPAEEKPVQKKTAHESPAEKPERKEIVDEADHNIIITPEEAKAEPPSHIIESASIEEEPSKDEPVHIISPAEAVKEEKPKKTKGKEAQKIIIADRFSHIPNSDISDILKNKPLANLSDAIGINDRFYFIREIFNGNKSSYNDAIIKLDKAASLKDAKAIIMSYTGQNTENEAVDQLLELVKRKFLIDE